MKHINRLIKTIYDQTGIVGVKLVVSLEEDGWDARIEEDGYTLLDVMGERYLFAFGYGFAEDAIVAIDEMISASYKKLEEETK